MLYWKGMKQTEKEKPPVDAYTRPGDYHRSAPSRKLTLEQEFLMVMMRLRLGLLVQDLAFRFQVSTGHIIGVSWPSGLAYRTQVLVLAAECGFESRP